MRIAHPSQFTSPRATTIRNSAFRDPELSVKAKGVLAMMLAYEGNADIKQADLMAMCVDGPHVIGTAIKELEAAGYVTCGRISNPTPGKRGGTTVRYTVHDKSTSQEAQG